MVRPLVIPVAGCIWLGLHLAGSAEIVINEIHYDPADETMPEEFIELHNAGDGPVDLGGAVLDDGVAFTFPAGTVVAPHGYLVVAEDPAQMLDRFGVNALGPYTGKLNNGGERIRLRSASGMTLDQVTYGDHFPWPTQAGGGGSSMELLHAGLDNDLGGSWRSSGIPGGAPLPGIFLPAGATDWIYRKGSREPPATWRETSFVPDGSWLVGATPIGYGGADDVTVLNDMQNRYPGVYLRYAFTVTGDAPLQNPGVLRVYVNDGAIVWINGIEVARLHVSDGEKAHRDTTGSSGHDAEWETILLTQLSDYLAVGSNTVSIHAINATLSSTDFSIDAELTTAGGESFGTGPTPGAANRVRTTDADAAPPAIRQVVHLPERPVSGQPVTVSAKVTDPDGVASVTLLYQTVDPGAYIPAFLSWTPAELKAHPALPPLANPAFEDPANWTEVPMVDNGLDGDVVAGDQVFTIRLPAALQTHRRLVRYRITATDTGNASIRVPYPDDGSRNFAWFVYDGVPAWTGAVHPGDPGIEGRVTTLGPDVMRSLPVYHLVSREADVHNCQFVELGATTEPALQIYNWPGTLVYDGEVYDHIRYRIRGWSHLYREGKNKWKFNFNRGRPFRARDNDGQAYPKPWSTLNYMACYTHRVGGSHPGEQGMHAAMNFRLFNLAGVPAAHTHWVQFRVVDAAVESHPTDQYQGDFWGLYLAVEQPDGRFLSTHDLPQGNLFKMNGDGTSQNNQGPTQPTDGSDLAAVEMALNAGPNAAWFHQNVELDAYYSYRAICDAVHHFDISARSNHLMYHHPESGRWWMLPWDVDLSWDATIYANDSERFQQSLADPGIQVAYQNRVREIRDLLFNADQGHVLIEELAAEIDDPETSPSFVHADRALWDYHPRGKDPGKYYDTSGGDFPGIVARMKIWTDTGWGGAHLDALGEDPDIPARPTVRFTGAPGYRVDDLQFGCDAYSDPQGADTFAAMAWRLGRVHHPGVPDYVAGDSNVYEIQSVWDSGEQTAFNGTITVPAPAVRPGETYRLRLRMRDRSGRWSHWSDPLQFVAHSPDLPASLSNLVISEIMYHPSGNAPLEFIEVMNMGTSDLPLAGVRFTNGIHFDFPPGAVLAPGGFTLVVEDRTAFEAHYGAAFSPAGEWSQGEGLDNGGERIVLSDGAGTAIRDFVYDDRMPWPLQPDGNGRSLVITESPRTPEQASSWRASTRIGGSPGYADPPPMTYAKWAASHFTPGELANGAISGPTADPDGDGILNLNHYVAGSNPSLPDVHGTGAISLEPRTDSATSRIYLCFPFRPDAPDLRFQALDSGDLQSWTPITNAPHAYLTGPDRVLIQAPLPTLSPYHFYQVIFTEPGAQ